MSVSPFRFGNLCGQAEQSLSPMPARMSQAGSPKILTNFILKPPPQSHKNLDPPDLLSRSPRTQDGGTGSANSVSIFQKYREKRSCWEQGHPTDQKCQQQVRVKLKLNKKGKRDGQNIRTYARYDSVIQALQQELEIHKIVLTPEDKNMLDEFEMKSKRSLQRFFFYLLLAKRQNKLENLLPNLKLKIRAKIQQKGGHRTCQFLTSLQNCIQKYIDAAQKLQKAQNLEQARNAFSIAYLSDMSETGTEKRPPHHNKVKGIDKCVKIYQIIMGQGLNAEGEKFVEREINQNGDVINKNCTDGQSKMVKIITDRPKIKSKISSKKHNDQLLLLHLPQQQNEDKNNNNVQMQNIKIQNQWKLSQNIHLEHHQLHSQDPINQQIHFQPQLPRIPVPLKPTKKKSNKNEDQSFIIDEQNGQHGSDRKKKLGIKSKKQDDRDIQKYAKFDIVSESSLEFLKMQKLQKSIPEICKKLSQRSLHFFFVILAMIQKEKKDSEFLAHLEANYQRKVQKRYSQRSEYFRERLHQSFFNLIQATRALFQGRLQQALDMAYEVKSSNKTHPAKASQQKRCKQIYQAIKSSFQGTGQQNKLKLQLLIQSDKGHRSQMIKQIKSPTSKTFAQLHLERIKMNQQFLAMGILPPIMPILLPIGTEGVKEKEKECLVKMVPTECKVQQQQQYHYQMQIEKLDLVPREATGVSTKDNQIQYQRKKNPIIQKKTEISQSLFHNNNNEAHKIFETRCTQGNFDSDGKMVPEN